MLKHLSKISMLIILISCNKGTEACFTYMPSEVKVGNEVSFNASCSNNASSYIWNFGDSTNDTLTDSHHMSHRYKSSGSYTVILKVERKDGVSLNEGKTATAQLLEVK